MGKMSKELAVAIGAAKAAGRLSLRYFDKPIRVEMKTDRTPVTNIDRKCEAEILKAVRGEFPSDSILAEEGGRIDGNARRRWIIDPIDGTKSFIKGLPFYGNLVAFEEDGEITAGAICLPPHAITIYAEKGGGAFCNGERIRVSAEPELGNSYILHGRGKGFLEKGYLKKLRILLNSVYHSWGLGDVYGYYLLASGRVDGLVETFPRPWDVAAPKIILEEAGGRFTDLAGRKTIYSNTLAISSNARIHDALIRILKK